MFSIPIYPIASPNEGKKSSIVLKKKKEWNAFNYYVQSVADPETSDSGEGEQETWKTSLCLTVIILSPFLIGQGGNTKTPFEPPPPPHTHTHYWYYNDRLRR